MTMTMMTVNEELHVGISEYKIAQAPTRLITVGLGSCIGTIIYDEASHIGGLSHIMLPDSQPFLHKREIKPEKFADLALPAMVAELEQKIRRPRFQAKIVGGANMFQFQTLNASSNIGQRNIEAVEEVLARLNIPIVAKHVGGSAGRTMIVDLQDFKTMVRQVKQEIVYL
ncbi:chemotaxis protein CheD [Enterococcus casseliflavus]|uniref:chemotaxis protein CheD n=1 Tax=Enterococcus casseliflavus TaxID=37734 RepID=UPI00232D8A4E|nr:chemotaxis protein CheD [Enterococcus casseliflavus]MDB1694081.1 chemotaxis protein CheD [Enterococcus casseliflavus]MDB1697150.1 chemotaxis protein CheD [Enterococcus casseliflavus]MDB1701452.1 chemotaxis protein CheD [Enterococcus casseliflavus]MDB1704824.1 chemotaxis protein CheD [Enterococcus casseliflavus]